MTLDVVSIAAFLTWVSGTVARRIALAEGWNKAQRQRIARAAPLVGAALGYALGAVIGGGTWRDVLGGALGGMAATWTHEATRLRVDVRDRGSDDAR
jgi:hypothetical protein